MLQDGQLYVNEPQVRTSASFDIPPELLDPETWCFRVRLGPNDSDIQRGDREDTGDNSARPTEKGSGPAQPTGDPTSFGGTTSIHRSPASSFDLEEERSNLNGIEVMEPGDGRLGLTNYGNTPADDWSADTGESKTPEGQE